MFAALSLYCEASSRIRYRGWRYWCSIWLGWDLEDISLALVREGIWNCMLCLYYEKHQEYYECNRSFFHECLNSVNAKGKMTRTLEHDGKLRHSHCL